MVRRFLPAIIVLALIGFVALRLVTGERTDIRSQLVGQPAPELVLPVAVGGKPGIDGFATGEPRLINLFGSWCRPCIDEAPLFEELAEAGIPIDGIVVRDTPEAVADFLARYGDPFARAGDDPDSQAMLALGATGVPETFLVDGEGIIRYHVQGPLAPEDVAPLIARWEALK
ncbi:redoxin domain-containing protein [Sphingomicrobium sediminis]|uniref:Redoxin domain-containing protein n=1 Tax=Sphingomicrobium sediminis TaxID=2950949 RepID=A0A9X2EJH1_9SPHN|nr:redoxin domain-containing protein [Sphingomicrobium sediminis]MCM8556714.1 redoxin domain-containing protein [Sphingomicrobium sediminis]